MMGRAQAIGRMARPAGSSGVPPDASERVMAAAGRLASPGGQGDIAGAPSRRVSVRPGNALPDPDEAVEIVAGREPALRRLAEIVGGAHRDVVIVDAGEPDAHLPRSVVRMAAAQGARVRSIYPHRLVIGRGDDRDPPIKVLAGEQTRVLVSVPATYVLVDASAAAAPVLGVDDQLSGLHIIWPSSLLDVAVGLAEALWEQAVPAGENSSALSPDDALLLNLLRQGLKDRAIARALGIGERTVQRRLSALMIELGAKTRFQAALNAVRRGWL